MENLLALLPLLLVLVACPLAMRLMGRGMADGKCSPPASANQGTRLTELEARLAAVEAELTLLKQRLAALEATRAPGRAGIAPAEAAKSDGMQLVRS